MFLGLLWILVGCGPTPVDYWTSTFEACQPPEPFVRIWSDGGYHSDACQEALVADLKLDVASFEDHEDEESDRALATVLSGAYHLLGRDMGAVEDLRLLEDETDLWAIREPFIEEMEWMAGELDQAEVRALAYNWAMSAIGSTVYRSNDDAGWSPDESDGFAAIQMRVHSGKMRLNWCFESAICSSYLVHEATHRWHRVGHVECPEGTMSGESDLSGLNQCDPLWHGPHGFGVAAARLQLKGTPVDSGAYETWRAQYQEAIDHQATRILAD